MKESIIILVSVMALLILTSLYRIDPVNQSDLANALESCQKLNGQLVIQRDRRDPDSEIRYVNCLTRTGERRIISNPRRYLVWGEN